MSPKIFFVCRVTGTELLIWVYISNLTPFVSILSYFYKAPEYGSNTDPDPQHCGYLTRSFFMSVL